jgi:hypothetical protein
VTEVAASGFGETRVGEHAALEWFLEALSSSLRENRGVPSTSNERLEAFGDPGLRGSLMRFTSNALRLPPSVHHRLAVALNRDQIPSKLWLIEQLASAVPLHGSHILVIGGWYGILPLLFQCLYPSCDIRTRLIDLDPAACGVAAVLLEGVVEDCAIACNNASEIDYEDIRRDPYAIVVNTICEHMSDFPDWFKLLRRGQRVALQSNDHVGCSEHTNCVASLEDFEAQAPLSETSFRGTLRLATFRRFMLIGRV